MKAESKEQLELFVQKADRVERSAYLKKVIEHEGTQIKFSWTKGVGGGFSHNFPEEEAIDALMLTARMFVQNNDKVSFGSLSKLIDDPGISDGWKARFTEVRQKLNAFLDGNSILNIDGKTYSHREIFEVFLYGHLAHSNAEKAKLYAVWSGNPLAFPMIEAEFHWTVTELLRAVAYLAHFTRMELAGDEISLPV